MDRHWLIHNRSIIVVMKGQNSWPEHCDMNPQFGAVRLDDLIEKFEKEFRETLPWTVDTWVNALAHGGGRKKRFQYCLKPYSLNKFLYFREIQGHLVEKSLIHYCRTKKLLPDDFAEYYEMHSNIERWQIPGGKSNRRDRQPVFFTAVNPTDIQPDRREVEHDLDKPRIAPYNTWRSHHNPEFWCNLQLAQRKGLRFYLTRSRAITSILYR